MSKLNQTLRGIRDGIRKDLEEATQRALREFEESQSQDREEEDLDLDESDEFEYEDGTQDDAVTVFLMDAIDSVMEEYELDEDEAADLIATALSALEDNGLIPVLPGEDCSPEVAAEWVAAAVSVGLNDLVGAMLTGDSEDDVVQDIDPDNLDSTDEVGEE